ncbi:MAG: pyridoxamine 5'-phosphate oxidase family protein [Selenomonadaceae bacterium]|nr:pyridoxamine 5'-phosphate oxidase family protein [Selenomonadaceae bacterium]
MRRVKCELKTETAEKILREGIYGVLALAGDDGYSYAVPLNYALDDGKIYFHSAKTGHKLDAAARNEKVSFCVVTQHEVVAEEFTSYFVSAIAFGRIRIASDTAEKIHALELLADKYSPNVDKNLREKEIARVNAVEIMILEIEHLTGKAARELIRDGKIS